MPPASTRTAQQATTPSLMAGIPSTRSTIPSSLRAVHLSTMTVHFTTTPSDLTRRHLLRFSNKCIRMVHSEHLSLPPSLQMVFGRLPPRDSPPPLARLPNLVSPRSIKAITITWRPITSRIALVTRPTLASLYRSAFPVEDTSCPLSPR